MYSMVMLMALSTGVSEPVSHHGGGCYGGSGCAGYSSCAGSSCHGGGFLFGKHGGCNGGYGCNGSSCAGSSCHGGGGFLFGKHGGCNGGYGCNGSSCHGGGFLFGKHGGCNGGCYGSACYGGCTGGIKVEPVPVKPGEKPKEETNQATIIVNIPANAKLTIDNNATMSTATVRTFASPALEVGKEYVYTLKAEIAVNGKTEVVTKEITVRANEITRVNIETPVTTTASK